MLSTMNIVTRSISSKGVSSGWHRFFSVSAPNNKTHSCKLLVVGGGSGGCTIAAKFSRRLKKDAVIVLEPSPDHFYQPLWTLVAAGVTSLATCRRDEKSVLPKDVRWMRDAAKKIDPVRQRVTTVAGDEIDYEYIVIAVGLENDYCKIPGLSEALCDPCSRVSTIFSSRYCEKVWADLQWLKGGEAVFTYPDTPIKCPGAPQKIAYLADSLFTRRRMRHNVNITYNTALPVIFGVKKYADVLLQVIHRKSIRVNYQTVLTEVRFDKKEAVYSHDSGRNIIVQKYDMLHVTPPMKTPAFLQDAGSLVDPAGYLDVDKFTLQHNKYCTVYGIGDCTNTPNSKTAAAVAKQSYVLELNLLATMAQDNPKEKYDGYGACPLVTSYNTCILAEFLYDGVIHETMPFSQVKAYESKLAYHMKRHLFPFLYWNLMLKGRYHGPEAIRRIMNPFAKCKLLIVGGGTGGCSIAWRFAKKLRDNEICVLDPSEFHYYQPLFPMVAAGIKPFSKSRKPFGSVLPSSVYWMKDYAEEFDPQKNVVLTHKGDKIYYDFLVVAVGMVNDYYKISGLKPALDDPKVPVTTIYSAEHCTKTWSAIKQMKGGHAIFTFPAAGAKCSGAAQKIMYLADDYFRKKKIRNQTNITYNTGTGEIFGVPKYASALNRVARDRHVAVNCCCELVAVVPGHAVFVDRSGTEIVLPFNLLHVTPPMSPPFSLVRSPLANDTGFMDVHPHTLRHQKFLNVYGLGDCTNTPNSKTAAAVARQSHVVEGNLTLAMAGREPSYKYDGYGACPMLTSYRKGILAEFLYNKKPHETFPFDQSKERRIWCYLKRDVFPYLYWNKIIKGEWDGPAKLRRLLNPFGRRIRDKQ